MNAVEIEEAISALAEQPFDAQEFPFAFLEAFGNKATTIKRLRSGSSNRSDLGGVLQTSNIHIKICDPGEVTQALTELKESPATKKAKAKFVLATDGEQLEAEDLASGETVACSYETFPDHFGFFLPLAGISTVKQIRESSFDIKATGRLKHVRSSAEKRAAEEIANRERCEDFEKFKPLFDQVKHDLDQEIRSSRIIRKDAGFLKTDIKKGEFFILGGQTLYVAEVGEPIKAPNGEMDARLRVIYSNSTESNILLRSLQRAIYKDETSRRISDPSAGPLFSDQSEDDDLASGTVYVLRSKSDHPVVAENREVLHKIGVTGGSVEKRIANAAKEATYLLAGVDVVATYKLYNINRTKLEKIIHLIFEPAKLNIEIKDRFGHPFTPREWFLVPLNVIDEVVEHIKSGTITSVVYDPKHAQLSKRDCGD